ncbi:hypothetical protein P4O66_021706 [Electrophorus voltai]|uniref:Uncharacterized protein n=1 Tax=Electrophorus voltai TaxID=2609070 RepID=A0AAD8ZQ13_9TELE|nr:hypothetical protein P4O66_021706 [Electrophorus voltai]
MNCSPFCHLEEEGDVLHGSRHAATNYSPPIANHPWRAPEAVLLQGFGRTRPVLMACTWKRENTGYYSVSQGPS